MTRTKIAIIALAVCCMALLAAGTAAYFVVEDTAYNVITTAALDMELVETDGNGNPFTDVTGVMPGETIGKVVTVKNAGGVDFWTRIKLDIQLTFADGTVETIDTLEKLQQHRHIKLVGLDTANWVYDNGFFYYQQAVKGSLVAGIDGESTAPLFTGVEFAETMENRYQTCELIIGVKAQAVQSRNNGTAATEAVGWSAE